MKLKITLLTLTVCACLSGAAYAQTAGGETVTAGAAPTSAPGGGLVDALERVKEAQRKAFTGSWEGILTPEDGGPPPFRILFTFGSDGTVVATDAGPPAPHLASSEHGAWERSSHNEFLMTYKQLLFDKDGNLDSLFKGRVRFNLNDTGKEINGTALIDLFDPQGNKFLSGAGTIKCTKIVVEPLD